MHFMEELGLDFHFASAITQFHVRVASFRSLPIPWVVAQKRCVGIPFSLRSCGRSRKACCRVRPMR